MKRHPFNLIELMLAMGVIVIGLVSIMALFPVGANANRDATAGNTAAQTAEQTLSLLAQHLTDTTISVSGSTNYTNWDKYVLGTFPDAAVKRLPVFTSNSADDANFASHLETASEYIAEADRVKSDFDLGDAGDIKTQSMFQKDNQDFTGGIVIRSGHLDGSTFLTDFEAMAAVWQEQLEISGTAVDLKYGTCLVMEVSWPAQLPYTRRQKARYRLEVFNPNL